MKRRRVLALSAAGTVLAGGVAGPLYASIVDTDDRPPRFDAEKQSFNEWIRTQQRIARKLLEATGTPPSECFDQEVELSVRTQLAERSVYVSR